MPQRRRTYYGVKEYEIMRSYLLRQRRASPAQVRPTRPDPNTDHNSEKNDAERERKLVDREAHKLRAAETERESDHENAEDSRGGLCVCPSSRGETLS
jgi:hypothetical protein